MFVGRAQADFIVTLVEVGPNVVATGSGAINLSGLTVLGIGGGQAFVPPGSGGLSIGPTDFVSADSYLGLTGPASFGTGSGGMLASSGSGDRVIIGGNSSSLLVPLNYASNGPLFSTSTWNNVTLNSLNLTPGTYLWSWGTGPNQTFTLQVGAVPEPATLFLLIVGILMLIVVKLGKVVGSP